MMSDRNYSDECNTSRFPIQEENSSLNLKDKGK